MVQVLVKFEVCMIDTLLFAIRKQNISVVKMILIEMKAQKKICKVSTTSWSLFANGLKYIFMA
jgi:hypothetical protein